MNKESDDLQELYAQEYRKRDPQRGEIAGGSMKNMEYISDMVRNRAYDL